MFVARRSSAMTVGDPSGLSPQKIGQGLALSVQRSCSTEQFPPNQHWFIEQAEIPIDTYHREIVCSAAFATDYAILSLLGDSSIAETYVMATTMVGGVSLPPPF
jgi:hypothetical protein